MVDPKDSNTKTQARAVLYAVLAIGLVTVLMGVILAFLFPASDGPYRSFLGKEWPYWIRVLAASAAGLIVHSQTSKPSGNAD